VSLKRTHVAEEGGEPGLRSRNAAFQTHGSSMHEEPGIAKKYTCIKGDKSSGSASSPLVRGRSIAFELIDNARVFSELSHNMVRLIDEVENTASKLVSPPTVDHQDAQHFSSLASQVLKNAQRGSATCKHIDAVLADSVDRIRQGMIVMEQAGLQMLHIVDSVIQGAEMTAFMGNAHPSASRQNAAPDEEYDVSALMQQEAALAVQDLKCWALVLKRNLQALRLSDHDDAAFAEHQISDGIRGVLGTA